MIKYIISTIFVAIAIFIPLLLITKLMDYLVVATLDSWVRWLLLLLGIVGIFITSYFETKYIFKLMEKIK